MEIYGAGCEINEHNLTIFNHVEKRKLAAVSLIYIVISFLDSN